MKDTITHDSHDNRDHNKEETGGTSSKSHESWSLKKYVQDKAREVAGPRLERIRKLESTIRDNTREIQQFLSEREISKFTIVRDDIRHPQSRPDTPVEGELTQEEKITTGPCYQRVTDIQAWFADDHMDTVIAQAKEKAEKDYSRMPPFYSESRKARKESKPMRVEGERILEQEAQHSKDVLEILQKNPLVDAVDLGAHLLNYEHSIIVSDLDHTLVTLEGGRSFEFSEPMTKNTRKFGKQLGIPFVPNTGRDWPTLRQAYKEAGPDGEYHLKNSYAYPDYSDYKWDGLKGKGGIRDSRVERYRGPTIKIQDAIEKQIKQDEVLNKYTDIKRGGRFLVTVTRKELSGTLLGGNSRDLIRKYLREELKWDDQKIEDEMNAINKRSKEIVLGVLKDHPQFEIGKTEYTGFDFGLNQNVVKAELASKEIDASDLEISNKAAGIDDIIHKLGFKGGFLALGDDITDTDMAKRLRKRVEQEVIQDYAFVGVKRAGGKIQENVKYRATFYVDSPEEAVEFLGKVAEKIEEMRKKKNDEGIESTS